MVQQPVAQQPMVQQPMVQQPMVQQPMAQQPVAQQPMVQQPMMQPPMMPAPAAAPIAKPSSLAAVFTAEADGIPGAVPAEASPAPQAEADIQASRRRMPA